MINAAMRARRARNEREERGDTRSSFTAAFP
jgi:hypothetical protein